MVFSPVNGLSLSAIDSLFPETSRRYRSPTFYEPVLPVLDLLFRGLENEKDGWLKDDNGGLL